MSTPEVQIADCEEVVCGDVIVECSGGKYCRLGSQYGQEKRELIDMRIEIADRADVIQQRRPL